MQPLPELAEELLRRQQAEPGSGKLDGERHAVETATALGRKRSILLAQLERRVGRRGALGEQGRRLGLGRKRRHAHLVFSAQPEELAARRQHG